MPTKEDWVAFYQNRGYTKQESEYYASLSPVSEKEKEDKKRGFVSDLVAGAALGGTEAVTGLGAGLGWLTKKAGQVLPEGGLLEDIGGSLEQSAIDIEKAAQESLAPQRSTGKLGRLGGRIAGEIGTTLATAGLGKAGLARFAPRASAALGRALAVAPRAARAARVGAVALPDIVLSVPRGIGASRTETGEIDTEALQKNLALEFGGSLLGGILGTRPKAVTNVPTEKAITESDLLDKVRALRTGLGESPVSLAPELPKSRFAIKPEIEVVGEKFRRRSPEMQAVAKTGLRWSQEGPYVPKGRGGYPDLEATERLSAIIPETSVTESALARLENIAKARAATSQRTPAGIITSSRGGFVSPALVQSLGGAAIGGTAGAAMNEEDPLAGFATGALLGGIGVPALSRALSRAGGAAPRAASEAVPEKEFMESAFGTKAGTRAKPGVTNPKEGPIPSVKRTVQEEINRRYIERFGSRPTFNMDELRELSKNVDLGETTAKYARGERLTPVETRAVNEAALSYNNAFDDLTKRAAQAFADGEQELAKQLTSQADEASQSALDMIRVASGVGSKAGLDLRMLQETFKKSVGVFGDDDKTIRRMFANSIGVNRFDSLSDEVKDAVNRVLISSSDLRSKIDGVSALIDKYGKAKFGDILLNTRRGGLLSSIGTFARNLVGGAEGAMDIVESPVSSAADALFSTITKQKRAFAPVAGQADVAGSYLTGLKGGAAKVWKNRKSYLNGIDVENPLDLLRRRPGAASISPKLAFLDKSNNAIMGVLAGTDRVFFEAAQNASLKERALLRTLESGIKPGTELFDDAVRRAMDPENMTEADLVFSQFDALNSTYKLKGYTSKLVAQAKGMGGTFGAVTDFLIPFPNTPENIIRKAMERIPGFGILAQRGEARQLKDFVKQQRNLGVAISDAAMKEQMRRLNTKLFSKQVSGAAMILAGYKLNQSGMLTGGYSPAVGSTDAERAAARERGLTGESTLALRVGDRSYGIASMGTFAPLLAMGAALSEYEKQFGETVESKISDQLGAGAKAAGRAVLDFPLLTGLSDVEQTLAGRGLTEGKSLGRQASTFIPLSGLLGSVARAADPYAARSPEGFLEGIAEKIPFARESLAPRVTALGEPIRRGTPVEALISPFPTRELPTDVDYEALKQLGVIPTSAQKLEGETEKEYSERRMEEGQRERDIIDKRLEMIEDRFGSIENIPDKQREAIANALRKSLTKVRSKAGRRNAMARRREQALEER